jgi:hypothetical protein
LGIVTPPRVQASVSRRGGGVASAGGAAVNA